METKVIVDGSRIGFTCWSGMAGLSDISHSWQWQISFGVAPASVGFAIGFRTFFDTIILTFYVLSGLTRLARFNVTVAMLPKDKTGKSQYFEGTPIPFACLTSSAIMATFTSMGMIHDNLPLGLAFAGTPFEFHPIALLFILNGCLMTSKTLRVPKPWSTIPKIPEIRLSWIELRSPESSDPVGRHTIAYRNAISCFYIQLFYLQLHFCAFQG